MKRSGCDCGVYNGGGCCKKGIQVMVADPKFQN